MAVFNTVIFSQWYQQQSGTNYALKSVYFTDVNTGYACGYNTILKTTNSGANWIKTILPGDHQSLIFTDMNTGYLAGDSGRVLKTTNSGLNWIAQNSGTVNFLTSVNFYNSLTGIATGNGKTLIKTTNGGADWFSVSNIIWVVDFFSSKIIDENNYYVTGTDSYIIRTTNGGANWISFTLGEVNPLFTIDFINSTTGYATGCCGMFMVTTNSGVNWSDNNYLSRGFTFHSLKFINAVTGFCSGGNGMMYRTTSSGLYWDSTVTGTDQTLYSIQMLNNTTGWVVGGYGTILKTTNGGGPGFPIGIESVSEVIPQKFSLDQNYPNPFNPVTRIRFDVKPKDRLPNQSGSENAKVNLTVFDVTGKEVAVLVNTLIAPGIYETEFDGSNYPSGVYYYRLTGGGFSVTRKMVLLK
ncbi:MAG TPA: YCF48-related protein [Ignavibacteria bacterium]|nr:YCF48-related protein [Ignavibacteria bacterium]